MKCHISCKTCDGGDYFNCKSCSGSKYLMEGQCVITCIL